MGHVDHSHQAKSDRQPERGEEQDAPQAQAPEDPADDFRPLKRAFDVLDAPLQGLSDGRVRFHAGFGGVATKPRHQKTFVVGARRLAQNVDRRQPLLSLRAREQQPTLNRDQEIFHLPVFLLRDRPLDQREHPLVGALPELACRREPFRRARGEQPERRQRPLQRPAQSVVDRDLLQLAAGDHRPARHRIEQRAALLDHHLLSAGHLQPAVEKGLEDRDGVGVATGEQRVDRLELCRCVAQSQLFNCRGIHRRRRRRGKAAQSEREQAQEAHLGRSLPDRGQGSHSQNSNILVAFNT